MRSRPQPQRCPCGHWARPSIAYRLQAAQWFPIPRLPRLAFDHKLVVRTAFRHLAAQAGVQAELAEQLRAAADALEGPWQEQ